MSQLTLTNNAPHILDSTCSDKKLWPKSASLRIDVRREVKPDVVASACKLPFRDEIFDIIYCDPPHIIRKTKFDTPVHSRWFASVNRKLYRHENWIHNFERFGRWESHSEWISFVVATNTEFSRCLKSDGVLEYKLCELKGKQKVKVSDLVLMDNFRIHKIRRTFSKSHNFTFWLKLKKVGGVASLKPSTVAAAASD